MCVGVCVRACELDGYNNKNSKRDTSLKFLASTLRDRSDVNTV